MENSNLDSHLSGYDDDFDASIREFSAAAKWMMFLVIVGYIFIGLLALCSVLVLAAPNGWVGTIIFLLISGIAFFPIRFLHKYASGIQNYSRTGDMVALEEALANQKLFWIFYGILLILVFIIIIIAAVFVGAQIGRYSFIK